MSRTLDVKFLACLLGGLAVFATGVHFLHGFQVKRNAGSLLAQADRAEKDQRFDEAVNYLERYFALTPHDLPTLARYGALLQDRAVTERQRQQAYLVLDRVLRQEPERHDVRRRQARLAMALRRFADAEDHLRHLAGAGQDDAEVEESLGVCRIARGHFGGKNGARQALEQAVKLDPGRGSSSTLLAGLLRRHPAEVRKDKETADAVRKLADKVIDDMVRANPASYRACMERAAYRRQFAPPGEAAAALRAAEEDLKEARRLAPDAADVFVMSADLAEAGGDVGQARRWLEAGRDKHPQDGQMYLLLAALERRQSKPGQAVAHLRQGLGQLPRGPLLLWETANLLVDLGQAEEAAEMTERLRRLHFRPELLDYLKARLLLSRQDWAAATRELEHVYPRLGGQPEAMQKAGLFLALCYERCGDADKAYAAYNRVAALNPRSAPARLGLGRTLVAMGQLNGALEHYRQVLNLDGAPAVAYTELARLLILRNLQSAGPDWDEVGDLLGRAEKLAPSAEVAVLQAEVLARQGRFEPARGKLLQAPADKQGRPVEVWVALAWLEDREGKPAKALEVLDEAERRLGARVELRLARARHWAGRKGEEARRALGRLAAEADRLPAEDRERLLRGLAAAFTQVGAGAEARRLWGALAAQRPDDLNVHLARLDLAIEAGDEPAVESALARLAEVEGPEGAVWRYGKAVHLIARARRGDAGGLEEARKLLAAVALRRPRWSRPPLCEAHLEELRRNRPGALANYLRAIDLGERSVPALLRAAELLRAAGRVEEAALVVRKLPEQAPLSAAQQRLVAEVLLQGAGDKARALELLGQAAPPGSADPQAQLWRGRLLWATGSHEAAGKAFRRALELGPDAPEAWVARAQFLTAAKRTREAEDLLARARQALARAPLALAQCYDAVGDLGAAGERYEAALAAKPADVPTLQAVAGFKLRTAGPKAAEPHLKEVVRLLAADPEAQRAARRTLALVQASGGDYRESRRALEVMGLLEKDLQADQSPEELRAWAKLLAMNANSHDRRQAIRILERLLAERVATAEDRFLLARLLEAGGEWPKARKQLLALLALPQGESPRYLAHSALRLLRHGEPALARDLVAKLRGLKWDEEGPFPLQALEARLLAADGKAAQAVALLEEFAKGQPPRVVLNVAALLEDLREPDAAGRLYERYAAAARARRPEAVLDLAQFLGRRRQTAAALDLCEQAWGTCPPRAVAQACLNVLTAAPAADAQVARVEARMRSAVGDAPGSPELAAALGQVYDLRGRYDEAEAVYRKALALDPRNVMALNNLAFLLALEGGRAQEALALVEQAAGLAGPRPEVLDTRAVVRLQLGAARQAVQDLQEVVAEAPSAAAYFHLAQARALAADGAGAKQAWRHAHDELKLDAAGLHPLERPADARLAGLLK